MKKLTLGCVCLLTLCAIMQNEARAQLYEPSFEFEKVIGSVYVGRQAVPLNPILATGEGTYLMMNLYVIASEDRSELVLIDGPGLPELLDPFLEALETEFPGAEIKAVLLTHDHLDHCWSIPYLAATGIPVYASAAEISAPPGVYDVPLALFAIPIVPGDSIPLGDGAVTAIDLPGHTPGHLGYAYYPHGSGGKINWVFVGDAVLAPFDHGWNADPFNITYGVRLDILCTDTYDYQIWMDTIVELQGMLTKHAKMFPGHGAVREGYLWKDPLGYIDHTAAVLEDALYGELCSSP